VIKQTIQESKRSSKIMKIEITKKALSQIKKLASERKLRKPALFLNLCAIEASFWVTPQVAESSDSQGEESFQVIQDVPVYVTKNLLYFAKDRDLKIDYSEDHWEKLCVIFKNHRF
jgi:uncharacterized protein YneR